LKGNLAVSRGDRLGLLPKGFFTGVEEIQVSRQRKPSVLGAEASCTELACISALLFERNTSCKA
jgi:hypothetical protein